MRSAGVPVSSAPRSLGAEQLDGSVPALEEHDGAVEPRLDRKRVGEELSLDVLQRRRDGAHRRATQLLDRSLGETREVLDRPFERCEGSTTRLVRDRHGDVGTSREGLEQGPLRCREILEAVGEDRCAVPGAEVAGEEGRCAAPEPLSVPEADASSSSR